MNGCSKSNFEQTMPKDKSAKKSVTLRHNPLGDEIEKKPTIRVNRRKENAKKRAALNPENEEEIDEQAELPAALGAKIYNQARTQRMELSQVDDDVKPSSSGAGQEEDDDDSDLENDDLEEVEEDGEELIEFNGDQVNGIMSEAEESVIQKFLHAGSAEVRSLADIIMEKIRERSEETAIAQSATESTKTLPPKVIEVYTSVGKMLHHYKSGKLPKALKMLPHLKNWEDVLWLTRPDEWSPSATYACTRIFASNLNAKMAQRFFNLVLLEKCRDDIHRNKTLNYHLYMALKKALFKPAAFYKGVLLPLAQSQTCTLREAIIFASVLAKVSIPGNHSAAALLRLVEMPYSGSNSLFIKVLLNKRYALPRRVIDGLMDHFCSFESEQRDLPIVWHQALLVFAQRYKLELDDSQRERLKSLFKVQSHHQITPEIRRELFSVPGAASNNMQY